MAGLVTMIYSEKKMLCDTNYYTVQGWMVNDLQLQGNELAVFAILWGFSQDGKTESRTPLQYIVDWLGCDKRTALRIVANLEMKGYIERNRQAGCVTAYKVVTKCHQCQNVTSDKMSPVVVTNLHRSSDKMSPASINNIINNNKAQYAHAQEISNKLFDEWFALYGGHTGRGGCWSYWNTLIPEEQAQVISHTKRYKEKAVTPLQPYDYLVKFQYWRDEKPKEQRDKATENKLTGMCIVREDGEYKTVTKAYAEEKGLKIITDYDDRTHQ